MTDPYRTPAPKPPEPRRPPTIGGVIRYEGRFVWPDHVRCDGCAHWRKYNVLHDPYRPGRPAEGACVRMLFESVPDDFGCRLWEPRD